MPIKATIKKLNHILSKITILIGFILLFVITQEQHRFVSDIADFKPISVFMIRSGSDISIQDKRTTNQPKSKVFIPLTIRTTEAINIEHLETGDERSQ